MVMFFLIALIADVVFGALEAWQQGHFRLQKVAEGIREKTLPFGAVIIFGKLLQMSGQGSHYENYVTAGYNSVFGIVIAGLTGSILENASVLIGRPINIPGLGDHPLDEAKPVVVVGTAPPDPVIGAPQ